VAGWATQIKMQKEVKFMGTVRKLVSPKTSKVSWQIDYLDPDGKRIRKNFQKQKDAKAHLTKYENDINTPH
jgi:hypothetical protein